MGDLGLLNDNSGIVVLLESSQKPPICGCPLTGIGIFIPQLLQLFCHPCPMILYPNIYLHLLLDICHLSIRIIHIFVFSNVSHIIFIHK
jgi:hypothetical protein